MGHQYDVLEQPEWLQPHAEQVSLLISHQVEMPANVTLLASCAFCPIVAHYIGDQVLCFQGRSEFVPDYSRQDVCGVRVYQQGTDSFEPQHQGNMFMRFVAQQSIKLTLAEGLAGDSAGGCYERLHWFDFA